MKERKKPYVRLPPTTQGSTKTNTTQKQPIKIKNKNKKTCNSTHVPHSIDSVRSCRLIHTPFTYSSMVLKKHICVYAYTYSPKCNAFTTPDNKQTAYFVGHRGLAMFSFDYRQRRRRPFRTPRFPLPLCRCSFSLSIFVYPIASHLASIGVMLAYFVHLTCAQHHPLAFRATRDLKGASCLRPGRCLQFSSRVDWVNTPASSPAFTILKQAFPFLTHPTVALSETKKDNKTYASSLRA